MATNVPLLKRTLAELQPRDQKIVFKYMQTLMGIEIKEGGVTTIQDSERSERMLYDTMCNQVDMLLKTKSLPFEVFRSRPLHKELVALNQEIEAVIHRGFKKLTSAQRLRFYQIVCGIIIGRISKMEIPLSTTSFIRTSRGKVAGIIDGAFPGYIRNGWLPMMLTSNNTHLRR